MKTKLLIPVIVGVLLLGVAPAMAKVDFNRLKGRILLRVESNGEAYYMAKSDLAGSMGSPENALIIMRTFGVGITNSDLTKIPVGFLLPVTAPDADNDGLSDIVEQTLGTNKALDDTDGDGYNDYEEISTGHSPLNKDKTLITDKTFAAKQKGRIFLQVESLGEAWYVNPLDGKRYFLGKPQDAFNVMRSFGLGISEKDFEEIPNICEGYDCRQ